MSKALEALVGLSYRGVSGKAWDTIQALGGMEAVWSDQTRLCQVLGKKRQLQLDLDCDDKHIKSHVGGHVAVVSRFIQQGGQILGLKGPHELGGLMRAPSKPLCGYLLGNKEILFHHPMVAIVGSRRADLKGLTFIKSLAKELTKGGCTIVSGGATGIDFAAHEGALEVSGETLAILGNPMTSSGNILPGRIKNLGPSCSALTLYGPWVKPGASLFVARNQYVAALSDAVIVAQGLADSGALYTAEYAHKMGVPVWAIPGDVGDPLYEAPNGLLEAQKARALVNSNFFLKTLGLGPVSVQKNKPKLPPHPILGAMSRKKEAITFDELCELTGHSPQQMQLELLHLELEGHIVKTGATWSIG